MRFKKAPLKAPGGESSDIIIKEEIESYSDATNEEMPNTTHAEESSHLVGLGRPLVQGVSGILPALQPARTSESYLNKDEETQAAQAKLRQYEALGLIKVEVDEPSEDEGGHIKVSDPLDQMIQHSSAVIPVTGSQQSNTFQGPRAGSEISVPLYAVPQTTAVVMPQQQQTFTVAKTGGVVDVPALTDMEGDYGFSVTIEEKERTTKSPMWLMSSVTNKLYTNINKAVPFEIQLRKKVPSDKSFYIRAVAVFSSAQFLRTNVTRCPNHASTADMTNHGFPYPTHVVRADHPEAKYEESLTGRLSVVVPLDKLVDGSDYTPILLRFMCLGSCVGGINRRPIAIILTLENASGQVFGRKVIDVRVCACPTRDIRTDELALLNKGGKRRGSSHQEKTLPPPRKKPKVEPKVEPQDDDNKIFTIVVRGRKLYEFLTLVKESYLKTHPECSDRYHDPSFQNEDSSEDEVKNSNSQGFEAGDSDSVSWDSGCNYTQQVGVGFCNDSEVDLVSCPKNNSPLSKLKPNISISPSSLNLRLWQDVPSVPSSQDEGSELQQSSKANEIISNSKTVGISVTSDSLLSSKSSITYSHLPKKDFSVPKHIPVMQVESYQPGALTVKAKPLQLFKSNFAHSKGDKEKKINVKKNLRETVSLPSFEQTESSFDTSPRKQYMSPDSPEMLAANVLAEGFKGKTVFKTTVMK
ncbi:tumor protein 63-like isoform X4 [Macrobrachium rosenbergii]|uniref:tumor protein 63-like isoform X4 n=1 Tax=Macrobrachium rosenbergii TaxID=79674 RepID=UPI0034D62EA4